MRALAPNSYVRSVGSEFMSVGSRNIKPKLIFLGQRGYEDTARGVISKYRVRLHVFGNDIKFTAVIYVY